MFKSSPGPEITAGGGGGCGTEIDISFKIPVTPLIVGPLIMPGMIILGMEVWEASKSSFGAIVASGVEGSEKDTPLGLSKNPGVASRVIVGGAVSGSVGEAFRVPMCNAAGRISLSLGSEMPSV